MFGAKGAAGILNRTIRLHKLMSQVELVRKGNEARLREVIASVGREVLLLGGLSQVHHIS